VIAAAPIGRVGLVSLVVRHPWIARMIPARTGPRKLLRARWVVHAADGSRNRYINVNE